MHLRAVFAGDHRAKQKVAKSRESVAIAAAVEGIEAGQGIGLVEIESRALGALRTYGAGGTDRPGRSGRAGHARRSSSTWRTRQPGRPAGTLRPRRTRGALQTRGPGRPLRPSRAGNVP